jgi:hypothetical protein
MRLKVDYQQTLRVVWGNISEEEIILKSNCSLPHDDQSLWTHPKY